MAVKVFSPEMAATSLAGHEVVAGIDTANHPVEQGTWTNAVEFSIKLSQMELLQPVYSRDGIRVAERLERDGIHCNLTLLCSVDHALACAEAGVTAISPSLGWLYDWHKEVRGGETGPDDELGVAWLAQIFQHIKRHGYPTQIASVRTTRELVCGSALSNAIALARGAAMR